MPLSEEELVAKIKEAIFEKEEARRQITFHRKGLLDAETKLVGAKLEKDMLEEQLRRLRDSNVATTSEAEDRDLKKQKIEEFKERLPEVMKKI